MFGNWINLPQIVSLYVPPSLFLFYLPVCLSFHFLVLYFHLILFCHLLHLHCRMTVSPAFYLVHHLNCYCITVQTAVPLSLVWISYDYLVYDLLAQLALLFDMFIMNCLYSSAL